MLLSPYFIGSHAIKKTFNSRYRVVRINLNKNGEKQKHRKQADTGIANAGSHGARTEGIQLYTVQIGL